MSLSGTGTYLAPTPSTTRHPWHPPAPSTDPIASGHLLLRNTLTGKKEPFVPHTARHIKWYTCGPTVYDSSHVGHARTYLSFDIMRRIMSDYFHYNVLYQVNTTDIDDKIILRARQNELMRQLEEDASVDFEKLKSMAKEALEEAKAKSEEKRLAIEAAVEEAKANNDSRARTEQEGLLEQHLVKMKNLDKDEANIVEACNVSSGGDARANLLKAAKSVLAEKLDREKGHLITDHAVFNAHARKYEREFMEDMEALGIREPDVLTRVTEYVPKIITFVETIIEKGLAYKSNGSVYLSLDAFEKAGHNYRKLNPAGPGGAATSEAEMAEGEGALASNSGSEKRNPNDFALWKASKAGEPAWESPFGPGRPGWHIECSVVAGDILGETVDIHSGGEDLKFPHHDNELAQSEACFGCNQWVNYFTHTGHLHIEGLKMSKSLKNFITIRQALEHNTARQLRIMFLLQAWDQPMNYSDQTIDDARSKETTFKNFFREVEALVRDDYLAQEVGWRMDEADHKLSDAYLAARQLVHESLLDNFNTKEAMTAMLKVINEANTYLRAPNAKPCILLLRAIATYITQILKVFGVVNGSDDFGYGGDGKGDSRNGAGAEPYIGAMVSFRESVRNAALEAAKGADAKAAINAILQICDGLRDNELPKLGVRLEDRPTGTMWNLEDPEVMLREMEQKAAQEKEIQISKLEKQLIAKEKELEKVKSSMVKPEDLFRTDEFKEWDESGVPITMANGEAVSGGQVKKRKKAVEKQAKMFADLMEKSGNNPQELLDSTQSEVDSIRAKLSELSL
jgi:cysteinyl-tRNA synthetase